MSVKSDPLPRSTDVSCTSSSSSSSSSSNFSFHPTPTCSPLPPDVSFNIRRKRKYSELPNSNPGSSPALGPKGSEDFSQSRKSSSLPSPSSSSVSIAGAAGQETTGLSDSAIAQTLQDNPDLEVVTLLPGSIFERTIIREKQPLVPVQTVPSLVGNRYGTFSSISPRNSPVQPLGSHHLLVGDRIGKMDNSHLFATSSRSLSQLQSGSSSLSISSLISSLSKTTSGSASSSVGAVSSHSDVQEDQAISFSSSSSSSSKN